VRASARAGWSEPELGGLVARGAESTSRAAGVREAGPTATDLRLALPAATAWVSATVATRAAPPVGGAAAAAAVVVASVLLLAVAGPDRGRRPTRPPAHPPAGPPAHPAADAPAHLAAGPPAHPAGGPPAHPPNRKARVGARRRRARSRALPGVRPGVTAAALCLAVAAAVLASGAAQRHATAHGLLPEAAREETSVRLVATVTGDPRALPPSWPGAPVRITLTVAAERVTSHGRTGRAVGQVLVVGPSSWRRASYRARIEVSGRLSAQALHGRTVAVLTTAAAPDVIRAAPSWARVTSGVRSDVLALADRQPGDAGALLAAIVVGDTNRVPPDLTAALRASGLTHVTAVSGAHFSLVVALVLALTTAARAPTAARAAAALAATGATVALVHPDPSVQRAAAMGLVAVLGLVVGRRAQSPAALAAGVCVLLAVDPWLATELGFVLSVVATGGLVVVGRPLTERWSSRLGRAAAEALALPVAAQLCCAPVLLLVQPAVATYAVPANVLAAPAVGPATVLGLLAGLVDPVCAPAAQALAACAGAACWWVGAVARVTSAAPCATADWLAGPIGLGVLLAAVAATLALLLHRRSG